MYKYFSEFSTGESHAVFFFTNSICVFRDMQQFEKKTTAKKAEGGCLGGTGREVNFIPGCFPENHFG